MCGNPVDLVTSAAILGEPLGKGDKRKREKTLLQMAKVPLAFEPRDEQNRRLRDMVGINVPINVRPMK
ncbi:MAG: hypothetical protein ACOZDY_18540 [Pseudomonadota bacterium]